MSVRSPVFGIVGWKNCGKTTLIERLVRHLAEQGLAVSTVKHAHHDVEVDQPGKDSWRHRRAGAVETVLASARRTVLIHEHAREPSLDDLLARMRPADLVLIEGFKDERHPKLEVSRRAAAQRLFLDSDPTVLALASDHAPPALRVPHFDLDDTAGIAAFVLREARR